MYPALPPISDPSKTPASAAAHAAKRPGYPAFGQLGTANQPNQIARIVYATPPAKHGRGNPQVAEVLPNMTERDLELLGMWSRGFENAEIAAALGIAHDTVKSAATRIFRKLGVYNRTEACVFAVRRGLI